MKEVKHYICEVCGTEYNNKNACMECEKHHKKPVKILKSQYLSFTQNKKGIPKNIEIEMDDGSKVIYHL